MVVVVVVVVVRFDVKTAGDIAGCRWALSVEGVSGRERNVGGIFLLARTCVGEC